ncbi:MAG: pseudouridine synthase [Acidobacteriota bacterium]
MIRLQVFLARAGVASRRACEDLIREGAVTVNGQRVVELGTKVDPETDHVKVRGKRIKGAATLTHLLLNKPPGVLSTAKDPEGRPTVMDLVRVPGRVYPVGRLDFQSEGLMLVTNDGVLARSLLDPRRGVPRVYHVKIRGQLDEKGLKRLGQGIRLSGDRCRPLEVSEISRRDRSSWIRVVAKEGKKHLVRDALAAVGHQVSRLRRVSLGPLELGSLKPGASRSLTEAELKAVRELTKGEPPPPPGWARQQARRARFQRKAGGRSRAE